MEPCETTKSTGVMDERTDESVGLQNTKTTVVGQRIKECARDADRGLLPDFEWDLASHEQQRSQGVLKQLAIPTMSSKDNVVIL